MRILIIDDDTGIRESLAGFYRDGGHDVVDVGDGNAGLAALAGGPFEVVICDYDLGVNDERNGVEICEALRGTFGEGTRFILFSGLDREAPSWMSFASKGNFRGLMGLVGAD